MHILNATGSVYHTEYQSRYHKKTSGNGSVLWQTLVRNLLGIELSLCVLMGGKQKTQHYTDS